MGTYAYIFVAGFVIIGGLTAIGLRSDTSHANSELYGVHYKEEARDAAVTGMNLTVRRVVNDEGLWTNASRYQIGLTDYRRATYQTFVTTYGGDTLDITSVGTKGFIDPAGDVVDTTHTIEVKIVRTDLAGGVPPAFDVAILTNGDLSIRGAFVVTSLDPRQNADVHANGVLETRSDDFLIEGYGSWTTTGRVRNGHNFVPNYDYNGAADNFMYQDTIQVPPMDLDGLRLESQSSGVYIDSDVNIDQAYINSIAGAGVSSFGELAAALGYSSDVGTTQESPLVIFSEQTIDFVGDVAMDGFGVFVSAGDLHINSSVNIIGELGESFFGFSETQMGIFTAGDLTVNGDATIQAQMYAGGQADMGNGQANLIGGLVASSIATKLNGQFTVTWAGPNEGIVDHFGGWRTVTGPVIVAWSEW